MRASDSHRGSGSVSRSPRPSPPRTVESIRRNEISRFAFRYRSADWQSAVSRIGNPQCSGRFLRSADFQSAIQQVDNLRYGRFPGGLKLIPKSLGSHVGVAESAAGPVNFGRTSANRLASTGKAWIFLAAVIGMIAATGAFAGEPTSDQLEFFEQKVRPLLAERCYKCHSAQSEKLKGGLLLDSLEGVMKGGEDGPVL